MYMRQEKDLVSLFAIAIRVILEMAVVAGQQVDFTHSCFAI
jgi:hypothetical protein